MHPLYNPALQILLAIFYKYWIKRTVSIINAIKVTNISVEQFLRCLIIITSATKFGYFGKLTPCTYLKLKVRRIELTNLNASVKMI